MAGIKQDIEALDTSTLPRQFDFRACEDKWRRQWDKLGIASYTIGNRTKNEDSLNPWFVIDSPPPTVSGSLHVGHMFSYTHQDIIARHRRMTGHRVVYPMGWDDNGLPTERRVQNLHGLQVDPVIPYDSSLKLELLSSGDPNSRAPIRVSRQNFIDICQTVTSQDEQVFEALFRRMGFSIDWRFQYTTIGETVRRIAQRSFLDLFEKGHVYQTEAPTMWDVDFQTAVAQAEVEDRERGGAYHDIRFGVEGNKESLVVSTTRPELLAACVGVAAHPKDERYKDLFGKVAVTPCFFARVPIFASEAADPTKGTGILMVCTFGDHNDVEWWRGYKLRLRQIISPEGRIAQRRFGEEGWESLNPAEANNNYASIIGMPLKQARHQMVKLLRDPCNSSYDKSAPPLQRDPRQITHTVRFFEKGDSPLEYLTSRQWFVKLLDKKGHLIEMGRRIEWRPSFMLKRYESWTENLNADWCISRQRFFGVPIPVWYRVGENGQTLYNHPILPTEKMLPIDPALQPPPEYQEENRSKPGGFVGETDVFDTWFSSSLSPQIVARWGELDDKSDLLMPMDMRPQSHEIIRTWAFYTIVKAMLHHDDIPWRNVVVSGWILDPDRKKMSKSRGNVVTPSHLLDQYGVDAIRYWAGSARLGMDTAYDEKVFRMGKKLATKIFNAAKFVLGQSACQGAITRELDLSFISDLIEVVKKASKAMEEFEYAVALQETERFFWQGFTDNYIELVKARARSDIDEEGRTSAVLALRLAMSVFLRTFAPFLPVVTDEVWSWEFARETQLKSVHQAPWPGYSHDIETHPLNIASPVDRMSFRTACEAIAMIRKAKTEAGIRLGATVKIIELNGDRWWLDRLSPVIEDVKNAAAAEKIETSSSREGARII